MLRCGGLEELMKSTTNSLWEFFLSYLVNLAATKMSIHMGNGDKFVPGMATSTASLGMNSEVRRTSLDARMMK